MPGPHRTTPGKGQARSPIAETDWIRVGETLRTLRELRGVKPDEFANSIGISRPYLANIEAGRKKLTNIILARAAEKLQVSQISIMRAAEEKVPA